MSSDGQLSLSTASEDRGEGPTITEICAAVGLRSKGTVAYHLRHLEERGALVRDGHGWRTCRLAR